MDIFLGETGLDQSWQDDFPKTIKCSKYGGEARIMFVAAEGIEDKYISSLHNNGGKGDYWFHDACSTAVYLCRDCFEASALVDQG